jgi:imipenem/basic amino acid-specific outer membrane pore
MKLIKMSLAAVMVLGTSGFAIENVKMSGDAKLFYHTTDTGGELFDQGTSAGDTALRLGVTADLLKGVSFGATAYAVSTLGIEENLVNNVWTGGHNGVEDNAWMGELWLAGTMGNTTLKAGRMELDTPFVFSEKWSIVPNTFEGAVVLNQDLPDTTLVAAWVGKGNGVNAVTQNVAPVGLDGFMADQAKFSTFGDSGAYAAGVINNSFKPLTVQAWYYNVQNVADAYWLQADIDCQLVKGLKIGAQYGAMDTKGLLATATDSSAYAFKLGYEGIEGLTVSAAYSKADKDGTLKIANVGTDNLNFAQSKLYTEAWWNYGLVGEAGSETYNLTALYEVGDIVSLGAFYTSVDNNTVGYTMDEITLTATKSFGPLDVSLVYINQDYSDASADNIIQAYLTLSF